MYRLSFQNGPLAGQTRDVSQRVLLVGADADCGLSLPDAGLAPRHARLEENAAGVFLSVPAPDARVLCNGVPVVGSHCLHDGDILEFGEVRATFQRDAMSPPPARRRPRISRGLMQPLAVLACMAFLGFELFLLRFAIVWPDEIYDYQTEQHDREEAGRLRERLAEEAEREKADREKAAAEVMALPGSGGAADAGKSADAPAEATRTAASSDAAESNAPPPAATASNAAPATPTAAATADALQVLASADFAPATPDTELSTLPPISAADPRIADAQRVLAQAIAAAQFADYAESERLFLDLHRAAPGFLPTYGEHAKMLEMQGHWAEALLRWRQLQGLAPENSPYRALAAEGIQRVNARIEDMKLPRSAAPPAPAETGVSFGETEVARLADSPQTEVAEMRVLHTMLELAPRAAGSVPRGTSLQVVVDFFDRAPDGTLLPSPALVSVSPDAISLPADLPAAIPVDATYVVPRGLRQRAAAPAEYYGYRARVFAGDRLLAEQAKPKRLLDFTEAP